MSVSDVLPNLDTFRRESDRVGVEVRTAARSAAERSARRIAERVRPRLRHAQHARLAAAVRVVEEAAKQAYLVGFDGDALQASGLNPMVPVWHEFGTEKKAANPALGNTVAADRSEYLADLERTVTPVLEGR